MPKAVGPVSLVFLVVAAGCYRSHTRGALRDAGPTDPRTPDAAPDAGSRADAAPIDASAEERSIAVGYAHTCAIRADGAVACWGDNQSGELGDGSLDDRPRPGPALGTSGIVEVAANASHTCARRTDGTVACWGFGMVGQLGDGLGVSRGVPGDVRSLASPALGLALGFGFSCARTRAGTVGCWGSGGGGQLGVGHRIESQLVPLTIPGLDDVHLLAAGGNHACVVRGNGQVLCWGSNTRGQLGDGTRETRLAPVPATGVRSIVEIAAGGSHTCARRASGLVSCWGLNRRGQLGVRGRTDSDRSVWVEGLRDATALALGGEHSCAIRENRTVVCWGENTFGQLGDGSRDDRAEPVEVEGLDEVVEIVASGAHGGALGHTCARRADGSVWCWGRNSHGQLGDGTTSTRTTPVRVEGL